MGSYDGVEVCKLVGTFILSKLGNIIGKKNTGLYCDNGLVVLRNMNARETDKMRNIIIKMFKGVGFQLETKTNLKKVEFLDVTFNLITGYIHRIRSLTTICYTLMHAPITRPK